MLSVLDGWRHFMRWLQRIIDGHARACGRGVLPGAGILAGDVGGASMPHSNALSQQPAQGRIARAIIDFTSAELKLFNPPGTDARASPVVIYSTLRCDWCPPGTAQQAAKVLANRPHHNKVDSYICFIGASLVFCDHGEQGAPAQRTIASNKPLACDSYAPRAGLND